MFFFSILYPIFSLSSNAKERKDFPEIPLPSVPIAAATSHVIIVQFQYRQKILVLNILNSFLWNINYVLKQIDLSNFEVALFQSLTKYIQHPLKAMCHIHIKAPMVTNSFPYFLLTSLLFGSKRSRLLFSYLLHPITCFVLNRKTNWWAESRETN